MEIRKPTEREMVLQSFVAIGKPEVVGAEMFEELAPAMRAKLTTSFGTPDAIRVTKEVFADYLASQKATVEPEPPASP